MEPDADGLYLDQIDRDQRAEILACLSALFTIRLLNDMLDELRMGRLEQYATGSGTNDLYPDFLDKLAEEPEKKRLFLRHLVLGHHDFARRPEIETVRAALSRPPHYEVEQDMAPESRQWAASARIARALAKEICWADMDPQEAAMIGLATPPDNPERGIPPLICAMEGAFDDDADSFVERLKRDLAVAVNARRGARSGGMGNRQRQGRRAEIKKITLPDSGDRAAMEQRIHALRYLFLKSLSTTERPVLGDDFDSFERGFETAMKSGAHVDGVVLHVPAGAFGRRERELMCDWWHSDCARLVHETRLRSPFLHLIYFESSTEEENTGFFGRLTRGLRDHHAATVTHFLEAPPGGPIHRLPKRVLLTWTDIQNWTENDRPLSALRHFEPPQIQTFRDHARRIFDTGDRISMRDFFEQLDQFPDAPPAR